jgi:hypothetical protein
VGGRLGTGCKVHRWHITVDLVGCLWCSRFTCRGPGRQGKRSRLCREMLGA